MQYLTMRQLQGKLGGRGRTTIYEDIKAGRLPKPLKINKRIYFIESEVEDAMRRAMQPEEAPQAA